MSLQGEKELRARLKALRTVAKPILRVWGEATKERAQVRLAPHNRTGATSRSLKVRSTNRRTSVVATWGARFVENDTKEHAIKPKRFKAIHFDASTGPVFARKATHPWRAGTPFLAPAARDALNKAGLADEIVKAWNDAG